MPGSWTGRFVAPQAMRLWWVLRRGTRRRVRFPHGFSRDIHTRRIGWVFRQRAATLLTYEGGFTLGSCVHVRAFLEPELNVKRCMMSDSMADILTLATPGVLSSV